MPRRRSLRSYQNSQQSLTHDALLIGSSARNPVLAQANAIPFAAIGAGALGAVAMPAAGSVYGTASAAALNTSIKVYTAGSAAAGAGANLYSRGIVELYNASANPSVNFLVQDVSSGTPGAVDVSVETFKWVRDQLQQ